MNVNANVMWCDADANSYISSDFRTWNNVEFGYEIRRKQAEEVCCVHRENIDCKFLTQLIE